MRLKEIPNTQLLVAVNHDGDLAANLEAFDVSRKGQAKKIYSFEEVSGGKIIINSFLIAILCKIPVKEM